MFVGEHEPLAAHALEFAALAHDQSRGIALMRALEGALCWSEKEISSGTSMAST